MKVTRERKIIGTILALAFAGFCVDRATSGPATASGATTDEPLLLASGDASNKTIAITAMSGASGESLAERLAQLAGQTQSPNLAPNLVTMRDVFRPSAAWLASTVPPPPPAPVVPKLADKFSQAHHLIAVTTNAHGGAAIVDGRLIRIGGTFDGFKLESIAYQSATFTNSAGERAELKLRIN